MRDPDSQPLNVFRGRELPEPAFLAGYAWLIDRYHLQLPLPPSLAATAARHHPVSTDEWRMLTPRHVQRDSMGAQIAFALKWEGVNLSVLAALFGNVEPEMIAEAVRAKPTGVYTRRLWFLYEWLTGRELDVPPPGSVRAVPVLDPKQQFALARGTSSPRHRVIDNLPGPRSFCPLVRRTPALERYAARRFSERARAIIERTHPDLIARAAAFLLLSDSRSSFQIEGEQPSAERAQRWARAIGQAGSRSLSVEELERLQAEVVEDVRFVELGLRTRGGFVGVHDRLTQQPLPDHVSARPEDLRSLVEGMIAYARSAVAGKLDPVVAAAGLAFGFVYAHPFEDGNGRLHRWLIHHALTCAGYNPPGVVFPVSAAILREIAGYKRLLDSYSEPLLPFIRWQPDTSGNVVVLNETADYYRYFDATAHAEFLYGCIEQTVERDLPREVAYLEGYDRFVTGVQQIVDMPRRTADLLHRFLLQNDGTLSRRAREREFAALTEAEVVRIQSLYAEALDAAAGDG
jgi:hypothetical protein